METIETNPAGIPETRERIVTVEKLVYGGEALARDNGQVILTPLLLPGETARISISDRRSQLLRGHVDELLTPSAHRVEPPCPHFGTCGGCHYQHASYEYQLEQKVAILREVFSRVGKIVAPEQIGVISGEPFGYRNRAQFHIDGKRIGYHEGASNRLHPIESCIVCSPKLLEALGAVRKMLEDARFPRFLRVVELFTNGKDIQLNVLQTDQPVARRFFSWCGEQIPGLVSGALHYEAGGFRFRVSHNAFFQINRFLVDPLVEQALQGAEGETALDLYSGVGLFSLALAKRFTSVTAVESGVSAWRDLRANAESAGVKLEGIQSSAENYLASASVAPDFVLADPPRSGLGKAVVKRLLELKPRQLTIVSCDPATLARDLAALVSAYQIESVTMVDLFPQTYHLESVVRLRYK